MNNKLSAIQQDFLNAFFGREARFFLTGGAALVGFYLGHRETHDLDLFTMEDALVAGAAVTAEIARQWGASLESIQTYPDFRQLSPRQCFKQFPVPGDQLPGKGHGAFRKALLTAVRLLRQPDFQCRDSYGFNLFFGNLPRAELLS